MLMDEMPGKKIATPTMVVSHVLVPFSGGWVYI